MENNFWIAQINIDNGLCVDHIAQFATLWEKLSHIHLNEVIHNSITWKLTARGSYSSSSAYKMQIEGLINFTITSMVWKPWAIPKCKILLG
jgi:hypothetical protein